MRSNLPMPRSQGCMWCDHRHLQRYRRMRSGSCPQCGQHGSFRLLLLQVHRAQLESKNTGRTRAHMALPQVLDYINVHFTEPIRLHWLAEKYNYNPAYFGRLFRRSYGTSFEAYLQKKRISYAKELLVTTNYSVDNILQKIGYTNKNNFYRAFLEDCGCTPKEFRSAEMGVSNRLAIHEKQE